jgi:hypothetical protein
MGFAINQTIEQLAGDDGLGESFPDMETLNWKLGYRVYSDRLAVSPLLTDFVSNQAAIWREIVRSVPEGGRALLVTHGGAYLDGTVAHCLPTEDHHAWGTYSDCCDGVRLSFVDNECASAEILRVK